MADFSGLNVEEVNQLRRKFHQESAIYRVVKNSLIEHACIEMNYQVLLPYLQGPTALAMSFTDPVLPVKIITDFVKGKEKMVLSVKAGLLENTFISSGDVDKVKNIPPREVLLAQILFLLESPVAGFVGVLSETLRTFLATLDAIIEQKQSAGGTPLAAAPDEPALVN